MTQQFNVGDTVSYNQPGTRLHIVGTIIKISSNHIEYPLFSCTDSLNYCINWIDNNVTWMTADNLILVKNKLLKEPTIQSAKELKAELESKILRLIQEFNKKTNLEVNDIDLNCYKALGGGCFYQVVAKVEI